MKIVGRLESCNPAERGELYLLVVRSGLFYFQRRTFCAPESIANLAITRYNEPITYIPQLDLEFELDGVMVLDVNLVT